MVILQRGVPAHTEDKHLRKSCPVSMSDDERERYAVAAQARRMSLSAFLRMLAEREINQVDDAYGTLTAAELVADQDDREQWAQEHGFPALMNLGDESEGEQ